MKARIIAAVALAAALSVVVSTASGGNKSASQASASKLVVWLQTDAQNGWPTAVAGATSAFKAQHPGADVEVQYQEWTTHLQKFDASIAANDVPDVIEMGNTETSKYMAARALSALKAKNYPNSQTWLSGLKQSCTSGGHLYCVPYYAGARAVIYRKDLYRSVGVKAPPKTYAKFLAVGKKLMKKYGHNKNFSAFYEPGQNWYVAMSFVADYGGQIAVSKGGKWQGTLNTPQAIQALTVFKKMVRSFSRASKTTDEAHPYPSIPFAKGRVGSFIGNGWEWPYALDEKLGNPGLANVIGAYPMPSHTPGKFMPTFLGGSDLAVPVTTKNQSLAVDWIKAFTSTAAEKEIVKGGQIANTTTLLASSASNPKLAPFARAAKYSWFVPTSPNWANVENANVLQDMLVKIFTGRSSVKAAANSASSQITRILNTGA